MTPDQINALRGLAEGWHKSGNTWCDICAHDLDGLIAQFTAEQAGGVDMEHQRGCPALGGYGHGVEACICQPDNKTGGSSGEGE